MTEDKIRILSMGWGVQTWALAAMVALGDLPPVDYVVHADTGGQGCRDPGVHGQP